MKKIALIAGNRLGDGLILQVIAHNLSLNGDEVTLYNTPLLTLRKMFPRVKIEPNFPVADSRGLLKSYDLLIYQHGNKYAAEGSKISIPSVVLYGSPLYMQRKSLVDIYMECLEKVFLLSKIERSNGIVIPENLLYRKHKKRVIIHPTSLKPEKNWPKKKFLLLAMKLREEGFDIQFTVSPAEEQDWLWIKEKGFPLVIFKELTDLAGYLYESGYMLGNDSGIAHLASNIGLPTLTLFIRPGVAKRWQPNFLPSEVVLPRIHLPTPKLQELFWKKIIGVLQVYRRFRKMADLYP